ncbi:unnamed protein product, partial [Effrenium voratum]
MLCASSAPCHACHKLAPLSPWRSPAQQASPSSLAGARRRGGSRSGRRASARGAVLLAALPMFRFQRRRDLQLRSWQGVEDRSEVQGLGKPSRVYCLRSFLPKEQVAELREYLRSSEDYEISSDSVDEAPTFEFYPCARGRWRDSVLERLLGPAAEELQQLLKQRLGAGALS